MKIVLDNNELHDILADYVKQEYLKNNRKYMGESVNISTKITKEFKIEIEVNIIKE
jgi:hypothetical protein